jgi:predicted component of type VI protein secretion system
MADEITASVGRVAMDYQLVIVRGRSASETIKLADGVTTVGRHDDCQLRIKSSQVSRRHCELFEKKGLLVVKDLGSSNGTIVNGTRVQGQRVLEPGDELTIGQVKLRVSKIGQPIPEPSQPTAKPGDTAVVAAAVTATADDDFEIEFDDEPEPGDDLPTAQMDEVTVEAKAPEKAEPAPKAQANEEARVADDAVADFLLDIKLDDEE